MNSYIKLKQKNIITLSGLISVLFMGFFLLINPVNAEEEAAQSEKQAKSEKTAKKKAGKKSSSQVKELSGISIIGNKEAPKSLYIVPWKNSEVGVRSSLTSGLLDDSMRPIDKEVFARELDFYELSHSR
ncbi:hypothetical protein MNBD_GAMMA09-1682 [hydrothermal vent metagenome]|uniref:Uncharacterized protein n=1 Tax=hydrothermal vent metagenome TaxID=652676 RepID=A0A3B0XYD3_9ZZZZ